MSVAQRVFHGRFGRVALLDMDEQLVTHAHSECHVLIKVSGEDAHFNVNGQRVPLDDRHVVVVNAWQPHCYEPPACGGATRILALYIEPTWLATSQQSLLLSARPDFFMQPSVKMSARSHQLAEMLIAEMTSFSTVPLESIEYLLFDLLIDLIENFSCWRALRSAGVPVRAEYQDARIRRAACYLLDNVHENAVIDHAIRVSGLSRAHFFALFRHNTGITPALMLNHARMRLAFSWLETRQSGTLGLLAEKLGFSEQGHFTRFFRQHIGTSPNQYRRVVDSYGRC